jgi:hypothetical protein
MIERVFFGRLFSMVYFGYHRTKGTKMIFNSAIGPNDAGALALVLAIYGVLAIMMLIIEIPRTIGMWRIFSKAGEKGWKALIPIYRIIVFLRIAGLSPWWVLGTFVNPVALFVTFYRNIKMAEKFNRGAGYGILMALFEPIMYLVLGFGRDEYNPNAGVGGNTIVVDHEEYRKQREEYDKAYAKYEKEVEEYNRQVAKQNDSKKKRKTDKAEEEDI